jgi:CheY-like chemotaxis protein
MADTYSILIIDDDPDIRDSIEAILEAHGFNVVSAGDAKEGIQEVNSARPDLVLCDMMMEQIDAGTKVAQHIKENHPDLPVYLLSSIGSATASTIELDKIGFNGVFQKPIMPDVIVKAVKKALKIE